MLFSPQRAKKDEEQFYHSLGNQDIKVDEEKEFSDLSVDQAA